MSESTTISFYAPVELREQLERVAREEDRSVSSLIRRALDKYLNGKNTESDSDKES